MLPTVPAPLQEGQTTTILPLPPHIRHFLFLPLQEHLRVFKRFPLHFLQVVMGTMVLVTILFLPGVPHGNRLSDQLRLR